MNRTAVISSLVLCLCLASCHNRGRQSAEVPQAPQVRPFPTVKPPAMMDSNPEILEYMAAHFWDAFADTGADWAEDSIHIAGVDRIVLEEQVGTYASILGMIPLDKARKSITGFYDQVSKLEMKDSSSSAFEETVRMVTRYLYDENSPVRNEDIYGALAMVLSKSPLVDEGKRMAYAGESELCSLNMAGTKAADFIFTDRDGRDRSLHGIKADYTLLFFSNPGCNACAGLIRGLSASQKIRNMVDGGQLAIASIYIDEEREEWRNHVGDYPLSWIVGYDRDMAIRDRLLYDVRAIPSLYLLDADKTVILKDAPAEKVLACIEDIDE